MSMHNNDDLYQKLNDMENKMYQLEEKIDVFAHFFNT